MKRKEKKSSSISCVDRASKERKSERENKKKQQHHHHHKAFYDFIQSAQYYNHKNIKTFPFPCWLAKCVFVCVYVRRNIPFLMRFQ
jgi:hypothetical protein